MDNSEPQPAQISTGGEGEKKKKNRRNRKKKKKDAEGEEPEEISAMPYSLGLPNLIDESEDPEFEEELRRFRCNLEQHQSVNQQKLTPNLSPSWISEFKKR